MEKAKQMKTVCCECHCLINEDCSVGRHLTDTEYTVFGQNADGSHGICKECYDKAKQQLATYSKRKSLC